MRAFKDFFKLKTGKEWDERFGEKLVPPMRDSEGNILPAHEGWFRFEDQIGILASFMRYAPPVVGGENGQGPESRVDGSFSAQNQGIPGSEMQDEEKGGEESDRVGIGEPCGEDDMVALKRLKTEVGMAAVLIDR